MTTFYEVIQRIIFPYKSYILIITILLMFIIALTYYRWSSISQSVFKDVANSTEYKGDDINNPTNSLNPDNEKNIIMTFYSVDWCPYCVGAFDIYSIFSQTYHNKIFNANILTCNPVKNCSDSNANCGRIDSFPTFEVNHKNKKYYYEADEITVDGLRDFVEQVSQI